MQPLLEPFAPLARHVMNPRLRGALACGLGAALLGACVFGFRGEVDFADEASLAGVETVQLHLPATELVVAGDGARSFVDWQGRWVTLGGSAPDALTSAHKAELLWETWEQVGRLSASLPAEIRDITALDSLEVQTASYIAHEIVGTGDVFVTGVDAYVSVELDGGDVQILGGTEQLRVHTTRGDVELSTSAAVDVYSGFGRVTVDAEAGRDIEIETTGQVVVNLAKVSDLDIDIEGAGALVIDLDTASHVGAGNYRRSIGQASAALRVRSHGGRVELGMLALVDDP
ncbi:hypothetical protein ENSA5_42590 [Enhygromyxa salina]|uniref:Adhesin domain-containing protein n=1 Tax=Enhygromyxa salina TaxID=215803 RepID=A0A2S9XLT7_9BACT|nr:hypothetical protein [Enhygromyxa salina]PRP93854.1 hypothetical protein ENSA5_42590 [Enhygromyxa salina]